MSGVGASLDRSRLILALAMTASVLRALGATPEQIDRERQRVYVELLEKP